MFSAQNKSMMIQERKDKDSSSPLTFSRPFLLSGYPANPRHHPSFPGCPDSAGPDLPSAAVLRHPVGPGPAQQVRVPGAVSACPPAGTQAAAREVAEGRQGISRSLSWPGPFLKAGSLFTCLANYFG